MGKHGSTAARHHVHPTTTFTPLNPRRHRPSHQAMDAMATRIEALEEENAKLKGM